MTDLSAAPKGYPMTAQAKFTAQYLLAGHCAAEFECIGTATVFDGMVYDYGDIWVDAGGFNRDLGRHVERWVEPDPCLEKKILEYLHMGEADDLFRDAAI